MSRPEDTQQFNRDFTNLLIDVAVIKEKVQKLERIYYRLLGLTIVINAGISAGIVKLGG
jgi:hypothetical protein